jgi:hypothetical protein
MRLLRTAVAAACALTVVVWVPRPAVVEAALPGCAWANTTLQQCSIDGAWRPRGSIGLLGDSVMLGSANGMSNPGLPTMLGADGWGPVVFTATLGMRTRNDRNPNVSAWHQVDRWQRAGFRPDTYAINLGGNHLADCTLANTAPCRWRILELLAKIGPGPAIWWSKFTYYPFGGAPGPGMLAWNQALDEVAASWPNMVVWDWPAALATANPPIAMDTNRVHPRSGVEYVKRSRLMAADISARVGVATRVGGPAAIPPASTAGGLTFVPLTVGSRAVGPFDQPAGATFALDASGPPSARAVALTVRIVGTANEGYLTVHPCDAPRALVSNGNFNATNWGSIQAIVRLPADGRVCVYTYAPARVTIDVQGWFVDDGSGLRLTTNDPSRLIDTRITGRAATYQLALPGAAAAALNIAVTNTATAGAFSFSNCEGLAAQPQSSFPPGRTVASAAYVPVSSDGRICISGPTDADLIVDVTGVFSATGALRFTPSLAGRLLDTRDGTGGWRGRQASGQTIDFLAGPPGAQAVTGTLTMAFPGWEGFERANPCGGATPIAAAVNSAPAVASANNTTVALSGDQRLCVFTSAPTDTVFDIAGWWAP